ncbi:hypothetical protein M752DRAFT_15697 [Aspergillus phoenicis ATCC 13157]|uniref:Uncharacterized protein n=1 Tax=Aspergillus phoenicis ATCC 13157 TaxID=1353007 RepID=A0A370PJN2_ASPPH|nr:hypothetical protein M752DRAFT_15697 [Aspergillus phoenicis ATCC 13157]
MSLNPLTKIVRNIQPESGFASYRNSAKHEVEKLVPSLVVPPVEIYKDIGPAVVSLMRQFTSAYPKLPEEIARKIHEDRHRIKASYEIIALRRGILSLEKVPTFIMIRLLDRGARLEMQAISQKGSEIVNWKDSDIVEISGADYLELQGDGTWVGIGVTYKVEETTA